MKPEIAVALLENLIDRVIVRGDGRKEIPGVLTDSEIEAIRLANSILAEHESMSEESKLKTADSPDIDREINLNFHSLDLPDPPEGIRLCLDFGTAMSKATLVSENSETDEENINVLPLGIPGDQEEISEVMLTSSVFIDDTGLLWFGKAAVDRSMIAEDYGKRQRIDNIKHSLTEGCENEIVDQRFNPTDEVIAYRDMVLAYLMFMTWTVNVCLKDLGYPSNLPRRFAMPCLTGERKREVQHRLKQFLGMAQVLADTFGSTLVTGLPISRFMVAVRNIDKHRDRDYPYVKEAVTEPLGVAGSIMSWKKEVNNLVMVVDIGAGTTDLSLYRLGSDSGNDKYSAYEVGGSSRVLTEAGNYLDSLLIEQIIMKIGITSDDQTLENIRGELKLRIRNDKESLFNDRFVLITLMNGTDVEISLDEFLELEAVQKFGRDLRDTMIDILKSINHSFVGWILANPARKLVVSLTGGGAELPMVQYLAEESVYLNGREVPVDRSLKFPEWLRELDENLESDYPRIAVSLGGARKNLINDKGVSTITGGDITKAPTLEGFYLQ